MNKAKGGKKNRKMGRNKLKCEAYRREQRQEKNAALRAARHQRLIAFFLKRAGQRAALLVAA